jgi:hypothetical protein
MNDTQIDQSKESSQHQGLGSLLAPLFSWQGRDVYPVFGAEGDDDGGEGGSDSDQGTGDTDDDTGTSGDDNGSDTVSREDFEKLRKQLSAADKRREESEKKLKEIDDSKKDELTKATERAEELEKTVAARDKELADMRLQNAFLTADTGITWHDPADALALAERQGYLAEVVGEGGKVDSKKLATKLKELAKAKPHLVKGSSEEGGNEKEPKTPTGTKVGSKGSSGGNKGEEIPSRYKRFIDR